MTTPKSYEIARSQSGDEISSVFKYVMHSASSGEDRVIHAMRTKREALNRWQTNELAGGGNHSMLVEAEGVTLSSTTLTTQGNLFDERLDVAPRCTETQPS